MVSEYLCNIWQMVSSQHNPFTFIPGILGVYPHCDTDLEIAGALEMARQLTAQYTQIADRPRGSNVIGSYRRLAVILR